MNEEKTKTEQPLKMWADNEGGCGTTTKIVRLFMLTKLRG